VVEGLTSQAVEDWRRIELRIVSPAIVIDDGPAAHGNSRQRVRRREHQHRVCRGQDLRCLRHYCRCRRLSVICMKVVDCRMALVMKTAEQDLLEWQHTDETC